MNGDTWLTAWITTLVIMLLAFVFLIGYSHGQDVAYRYCDMYGKIQLEKTVYECSFKEVK